MTIIIDTGPLVAALNCSDTYHSWAVRRLTQLTPPLLTCESVLTEVSFLVQHKADKIQALFAWLKNGVLVLPLQISQEHNAIESLIHKYTDIPMSLADACLVRLAELHSHSTIMTLDSDFKIYRIHKNQPIQLIMPN